MNLSKQERWLLSNQYRILEKLDPANAERYTQYCSIIESGYELQYESITEFLADPLTPEVCTEVEDILTMYEYLKVDYDSLEDKSGIDQQSLDFPGFDGNNESRLLGYARFVVNTQKRFQHVRHVEVGVPNSHTPFIPYYRRMLIEWNKSADKFNLTKTDILRITSA